MAQALIFNGTAGRVDIPTKTGSGGARRLLLAEFLSVSDFANRCIVGNDLASTANSIRFNTQSQISFRTLTGTNRTVTLSDPLPTGEFTLEVFINADNTLTVFVDGMLKGTQAISSTEVSETKTFQYIGQCGNAVRLSATVKRMVVLETEYINLGDNTATTWGDGTLNSLTPPGCWTFFDAGSTTPISFTGNIADQTFTADQSVNLDLSGNWEGSQTPFTFTLSAGSLAGTGLTLSSAGVLSGTATEATQTGLVITGTDADTNTAVSNSFNITVNAAPTGHNVSINTTLPALTSALSMTFAASSVGTITISDWANNTGAALPDLTGITVNVRSLADGSTVYRTTTATTNAGSDCVVSDAAIIAGTQYEVSAIKFNGVDYDIGIDILTAT